MNRTNLLIDFSIFGAFLVALEPGLTGIPLHEWFAVAFTAAIITHLLLHWQWIMQVGGRFFRKLLHESRLQMAVDVLLFVSFVTVMTSGLMISRSVLPFFGLFAGRNFVWSLLHRVSANSTLALVGLHFALHWNWVVTMTKRYLISPVVSLFHIQRRQPAVVPVEVEHK